MRNVDGKPMLLDAFCCAGGATRGYQSAGFYVVGVDIDPQPNYCGDEFHQGNAVRFILDHWREFAGIHASPPCQASCALTKGTNAGREYEQLIPATRLALQKTNLPWIIENVAGAELRKDLKLCGEMFGLEVIRHRFFETRIPGFRIPQPRHIKHRGRVAGMRHGVWYEGPYFAVYGDGGGKGTVAQWQRAMGIDWTDSRYEIREAIPPAYTEYIGQHLAQAIGQGAAA